MILGFLNHRIRGFRTLNIVFGAALMVLAIGVNLAKTLAGRERNEIAQVESGIGDERERIHVLEAEVAHLEQPERLERLSRAYLSMAPLAAAQETTTEALPEVAGRVSQTQVHVEPPVQPQPQPQPVSTASVPVQTRSVPVQ